MEKMKFEHLSDWAVKDIAPYIVDALEPVIKKMINCKRYHPAATKDSKVSVDEINITTDRHVHADVFIDDVMYTFYITLSLDETFFYVNSFHIADEDVVEDDYTVVMKDGDNRIKFVKKAENIY